MIEAFDGPGATGNLLASASTTEEEFLGVAASGIKSVRFMKVPGDERSFCIDHFTFVLQAGGDDVPTTSYRGAIVLVLLILTVSTIRLFWRRRSET